MGSPLILKADPRATAAEPSGALIKSLTWEVNSVLDVLLDNVTSGSSRSRRGYTLTRSFATTTRTNASIDSTGRLRVVPPAAAVNLTITLPLSTTYIVAQLTERTPWTQALASIVGIMGIVGGFGIAFSLLEAQLVPDKYANTARAASNVGTAHAPPLVSPQRKWAVRSVLPHTTAPLAAQPAATLRFIKPLRPAPTLAAASTSTTAPPPFAPVITDPNPILRVGEGTRAEPIVVPIVLSDPAKNQPRLSAKRFAGSRATAPVPEASRDV